jgi:hypothetical protein
MKIRQHPRMRDIAVGDEVICHRTHLYAKVEEVFPAAVCVRLALLRLVRGRFVHTSAPQLWRAEDIDNLSVCRYCGSRDDLTATAVTGVPFRVCVTCRSVLGSAQDDEHIAPVHTT